MTKLQREKQRLATRATAFFDASVEVRFALKTNSDPVEALERLQRINEARIEDVEVELVKERARKAERKAAREQERDRRVLAERDRNRRGARTR
jgi:uncharacterized Ntn-hydrolase superfamily protein